MKARLASFPWELPPCHAPQAETDRIKWRRLVSIAVWHASAPYSRSLQRKVMLHRGGILGPGRRAWGPLPSRSSAALTLAHRRFSSQGTPPTPSTVDRGTRFEMGTMAYLTSTFSSMHLIRTGGANDGGVDLLGWWELPNASGQRVRVVVQCKSEAKKLGPIHVRELRGVATKCFATPTPPTAPPGLAILASSSGFSKQCIVQGLACDFPLLFVHLAPPPDPPKPAPLPPPCISLLPNDALSQSLLAGQMDIKHVTFLDSRRQKTSTPSVYWNGRPL